MNARRSTPCPFVLTALFVAIALASGPALPAATFTDNFDRADGPVDGWTLVSGTWQISGGAMTESATGAAESWIWAGAPPIVADAADMEIRAKVTFGAKPAGDVGRHGGFMFCASQATNRGTPGMTGYSIDWIDRVADYGFRLIRLDSPAGGVPTQTVLNPPTPEILDIPQEWQIQLDGDLIRLVADGTQVFEVSDATYRGGRVGVWAYNNGTNISIDDLEISYEPVVLTACFTASKLGGAAPLDVEFDATCTQSVNGVASYEWDFADGGTASGSNVTHTFTFGGSYMVTLTVTDTLNVVRTATATIQVQESTGSFSDDFERADGPVDNWVVFRGDWNISSGKLTTTSAGVENWAWAGDPAFSFPANFTMTFTLEFLVTPPDAVGRHGGVMFCATSATHRYDPTIDGYTIDWIDRASDHGIRLARWTNGVETPLDRGARDVIDPPVNWEIVVEGEIIRVFGDGVLHLEAKDSTYRQGVFGVWCWSNSQSIAVDDVAVTSPQLSPCFTMTPPSAAEAGTDVAVDASCASASGTPIKTYSWDFGDGTTGLGVTATHAYSTEGVKTVKLTILTEGGLSASTERTINIFVPRDSFADDFERPDGSPSGWIPVSDYWALSGGALQATVADAGVETAIYAGDPALWFRGFTAIEFDMEFLSERPADPTAVGRHAGVFFFAESVNARSGSQNDGYGVDWIDRQDATFNDYGYRIYRFDNGAHAVSFLNGTPGEPGPGSRWRIELDGDTIRLIVDGELKGEVVDATYRGGYFAFWSYGSTAATPGWVQQVRFDNLQISAGGPPLPQFHRGDANADGALNITDGIYVLNFLFLGGPTPTCKEAANPNDDPSLNITDGIYILNFLFLGGPPPTAPGPVTQPCGPDPAGSPTDLGCESYTKC